MSDHQTQHLPTHPVSPGNHPTRTPDALPHGTRLQSGAYGVGQVLGQGGFGVTYQGTDSRLHRPVAIKELFLAGRCHRRDLNVVPDDDTAAEFLKARTGFLREAQTLARFDDRGIVRVFSAFEENSTAYMVMEYLKGQTLTQILGQRHVLPEHEAVGYIERIGNALETVHLTGLLHRDINPNNIVVEASGRVVLVDFGLSKTADSATGYGTRHLSGTAALGTSGYAPLEQYARQALLEPTSDVYALGATLYHLLTGQMPIAATARAAGDRLTPAHEINPTVSIRVSRAIERAMELDAKQRSSTVAAFLSALQHPQQHAPAPASATPAAPPAPQSTLPAATPPTAAAGSTPAVGAIRVIPSPDGRIPIFWPSSNQQQPSSQQMLLSLPHSSITAVMMFPVTEWLLGHGREINIEASVAPPANDFTFKMMDVVRVSARVIDWPATCPCCGAESELSVQGYGVVRGGRRVIHQQADESIVPFCVTCLKHYAWGSALLDYQAENVRYLEELRRAREAPVVTRPVPEPLPASSPPKVDPLGYQLFLSYKFWAAIFFAWLVLLQSLPLALLWSSVSAAMILPVAKWREAVAASSRDSQQLQINALAQHHAAQQAQAQADAEAEHRKAVEWAETLYLGGVEDTQVLQGVTQAALTPRCCGDAIDAVVYAHQSGTIHTFGFMREEYASEFALCNKSKIVFQGKRWVYAPRATPRDPNRRMG